MLTRDTSLIIPSGKDSLDFDLSIDPPMYLLPTLVPFYLHTYLSTYLLMYLSTLPINFSTYIQSTYLIDPPTYQSKHLRNAQPFLVIFHLRTYHTTHITINLSTYTCTHQTTYIPINLLIHISSTKKSQWWRKKSFKQAETSSRTTHKVSSDLPLQPAQ